MYPDALAPCKLSKYDTNYIGLTLTFIVWKEMNHVDNMLVFTHVIQHI